MMRGRAVAHNWPAFQIKQGLAGSTSSNPAKTIHVSLIEERPGLADAATAPRQTATAAAYAAACATTAAAATTATSTATATSAAAAAGFLNHAAKRSRVLLVEHIERRQADVGELFHSECQLVSRRSIRCLLYVRHRRDRCGCTSDQ
jgi:hypothetical protein